MPVPLSSAPAGGQDNLVRTSTFTKDILENFDEGEISRPSILSKVILENPDDHPNNSPYLLSKVNMTSPDDQSTPSILSKVNVINSKDDIVDTSPILTKSSLGNPEDNIISSPMILTKVGMKTSDDEAFDKTSLLSQSTVDTPVTVDVNTPLLLSEVFVKKPEDEISNSPVILSKVSLKNSEGECNNSPLILSQVNLEYDGDDSPNRPVLCSFVDPSKSSRRTQSAGPNLSPSISPRTIRKNMRARARFQRVKALSLAASPFSDETMGVMVDPLEEHPEVSESESMVGRVKRSCRNAWYFCISIPFGDAVKDYYVKSPKIQRATSAEDSEEFVRKSSFWETVRKSHASKQKRDIMPCKSENADRKSAANLNQKSLRKSKPTSSDSPSRKSKKTNNSVSPKPLFRKDDSGKKRQDSLSPPLSPTIDRPSLPTPGSRLRSARLHSPIGLVNAAYEKQCTPNVAMPLKISVKKGDRNPQSPPSVCLNIKERSSSNVRVNYSLKRAGDTVAMWVNSPAAPRHKKKKYRVDPYDDD